MFQKKYFLLLLLTVATTNLVMAQSGTGKDRDIKWLYPIQVNDGTGTLRGYPTHDSAALIDMESSTKGLLLPRVALVSTALATPLMHHSQGMHVYNTVISNDVTPGEYYNDGTKWIKANYPAWFYMPSFNLQVKTLGANTFDLYGEYKRQFTRAGNSQFVSSGPSTTDNMIPVYNSNELEYFITAYPTNIMTVNSISAAGVMSYNVISTDVPDSVYINVVFKVIH